MKKKIIGIIIILIMSLISLSGCISNDQNNDNKNVKDYEPGDLILTIESEKNIYHKGVKEILINAILKNVADEDIRFNIDFQLGIGISFNITTPSRLNFYCGGMKMDPQEEIILKKGDSLKYQSNLINSSCVIIENNQMRDFKYDWTEIGNYSVRMTHDDTITHYNEIYSNDITFKIIK
jgi:hypothetical protein